MTVPTKVGAPLYALVLVLCAGVLGGSIIAVTIITIIRVFS